MHLVLGRQNKEKEKKDFSRIMAECWLRAAGTVCSSVSLIFLLLFSQNLEV